MGLLRSAASAGAVLPSAVAAASTAATAGGVSSGVSVRQHRSFGTTLVNTSDASINDQQFSGFVQCTGRRAGTTSPHGHRLANTAIPQSSSSPFQHRHRAGSAAIASSSSSRSFSTSARSTAASKDPYSTLGVKREASAKEIKGAYYDLAKKYHPDRSKEKGAKERFVEIQSAYDILSDEKKKASFDRYGTADGAPGFNPFGGSGSGGQGGPGFDPFGGSFGGGFQGFSGNPQDASDIFEGLFGAFGGRSRASSGGAGFAGSVRGDDLEVAVDITFEEACRGTSKNIAITPVERCGTCSGGGLKENAKMQTCKTCNGTGTQAFMLQGGFQMAGQCTACGGAGRTVRKGDECGDCEGVGRVRRRKVIDVKIPAGVDDGARVRMDAHGDVPMQGAGSAGALYVRIGVKPSKVWRRQGSNLFYSAQIPFHTAIMGGSVRVPTLDGDVDVRVKPGTQVGEELLMAGRGVPNPMRRTSTKGDLLIQFEVIIPRNLSKRQREILQQYVDEVDGKVPSTPSSPPPRDQPSPSKPQPPPPRSATPDAAASETSAGTQPPPSSSRPTASTANETRAEDITEEPGNEGEERTIDASEAGAEPSPKSKVADESEKAKEPDL